MGGLLFRMGDLPMGVSLQGDFVAGSSVAGGFCRGCCGQLWPPNNAGHFVPR